MKRLLLLLPLLLLCALPARAQGGNSVTTRFAGVPSGGCNLFQYAVNNATGDLYDCKSGAWFKIGPGTSVGFCTPPGVNHSILIDDGAGDCGDLGSLGTTTTVLHGNASGDPTFGAVVSADLNVTTTSCSNQFVTAISAGAVGTCTTDVLASAQHANQGTTTTLLHGNAAGNPSFTAVTSADLNITATTCSNQFVTAISAAVAATCTTATLASAQFANQGTTTTLLHGNGAGNPSFAAVNLASAEVTGQLPIGNVGSAGLSGTAPVAISAAGAISCSTCNTSSATVSSIATTAPITGGTITTTGTIACATCATTTNGGAISGTAPVAVSVAGAISITGAAGQVLAGATPAFTATPALGTDNSVAGTVQLANSAANAHTIFSSGATTTNTIQGFAAVPTTGRLIDCTVTSTTCLLHDSGISTAAVTQTIASGSEALGTGAIASGACATVVTDTATGTATTDNIMADFNADPTSTTGYAASANGMLTIIKYPTTNTVNFKVCNNTSSSITPGAVTLNWRVVR